MARKRLVVGNWKMNLKPAEGHKLVEYLDKGISASTKAEVVLCPPMVMLESLAKALKPLKFGLGAQNIYYQDFGAFTGEVSAAQVAGLAKYVIVGHSERRLHFGETNDLIARKVSAVVRNSMTPIICVGESLLERQDNETGKVLHDQLAAALVMLTTREVAAVVVAYEPVWAVDSSDIATPEQVKGALAVIRKTLTELYGSKAAETVRVLYGGHMEPEFAADYFKLKELDGFLVGRASLQPAQFTTIVKAAQRG